MSEPQLKHLVLALNIASEISFNFTKTLVIILECNVHVSKMRKVLINCSSDQLARHLDAIVFVHTYCKQKRFSFLICVHFQAHKINITYQCWALMRFPVICTTLKSLVGSIHITSLVLDSIRICLDFASPHHKPVVVSMQINKSSMTGSVFRWEETIVLLKYDIHAYEEQYHIIVHDRIHDL